MKLGIVCLLAGAAIAHSRLFHPEPSAPATSVTSSSWVEVSRADSSSSLLFPFALRAPSGRRNLAEKLFHAVSDPDSAMYGKYLSLDEVAGILAPSAENKKTLISWIENSGGVVESEVLGGSWMNIRWNADKAEKALGVEFFQYLHPESGMKTIRAKVGGARYSLPESLSSIVELVAGVHSFPKVKKGTLPKSETEFKASLGVTPSVLRKLYNVTAVGDNGAHGNMLSVTALIGQYFNAADLAEFEKLFASNANGQTVAKIIGPDNGLPGLEANLDVQYVIGVGPGTVTWFWSIPNSNNTDPFVMWMQQIANTTNPPQVHTTSYGGPESDETPEYLFRLDQEFMTAGLRGISLLFASGDSGVGCSKGVFSPDWPASSTYVTAVGGTKFSGLFETGHEVVNTLSGGGFSNVYSRPSYQASAVANYLSTSKNLPASKFYNSSGRGYPDVSALSAGFVIVEARVPTPGVAGTSCASPTFSAIIALLNQIRLANGKSPLGFLNPWIYKTAARYPGAFFDVTEGSNAACGTRGFVAQQGWDPSSGVGSPNYAILSTIV